MTAPSGVRWSSHGFAALATDTLYAALQLRAEVFVVEQACAFQDLDGSDRKAIHLLGHLGTELVAYARCFGPGMAFNEASFGRVVTRASCRRSGIGHELVERAMVSIDQTWGRQSIRIGAQARLKEFYQHHCFVDVGMPYIEDGIAHLEMLYQP